MEQTNLQKSATKAFVLINNFTQKLIKHSDYQDFLKKKNKNSFTPDMFVISKKTQENIKKESEQLKQLEQLTASTEKISEKEEVAQMFNDFIMNLEVMFIDLSETDKMSLNLVLFDYFWRKVAVDSLIAEENRPNYPQDDALLQMKFYRKIYKEKMKNTPELIDLKLYLGQGLCYAYMNNTEDDEKYIAFKNLVVDSLSCYYRLDFMLEQTFKTFKDMEKIKDLNISCFDALDIFELAINKKVVFEEQWLSELSPEKKKALSEKFPQYKFENEDSGLKI